MKAEKCKTKLGVANMDKVTHFEIPADDMKREQKFLQSVFGWKSEGWDEDYYHVKTVEMDKNWVPRKRGQ